MVKRKSLIPNGIGGTRCFLNPLSLLKPYISSAYDLFFALMLIYLIYVHKNQNHKKMSQIINGFRPFKYVQKNSHTPIEEEKLGIYF